MTFACLLFSQVTTEKTHCSTQALLHQGLKGFCVSASCGDPSCRRPSDTRLPHAHLHHPSSLPPSSIPTLACKMQCYSMSICVPAVFTRHHRKDTPLHLNAPDPGVERLLRQRVMRRPQQAVRRKASSHKPPPPLFSTRLEHPESGMQNVLLWHVVFRACCSHTSPPQRPTAPPKRFSPRGRKASASARHAGTHHAAGRQTQGFLTHTSITPLPYHPRASQLWHAKSSAMACQK